MVNSLESECNALGGLFQGIINDLKGTYPAMEDVSGKAMKLSGQLKSTISSLNLFLDALQKLADSATGAKGGTRDIGTAMTRICMRHRSIENRLQSLAAVLVDSLALPISTKVEEWKSSSADLDKAHHREFKRTTAEIKKRNTDTLRLRKKVKKGESGMQSALESTQQEVNDRFMVLLDEERRFVRKALIQQRSHFCGFVGWFMPVIEQELGLIGEVEQMGDVIQSLVKHSADPHNLPEASENVIYDIKGLDSTSWASQFGGGGAGSLPPSSPSSSMGSRVPSYASLSSAGSDGRRSTVQRHSMPAPIHYQAPQMLNHHHHAAQQIYQHPAAAHSPRFSTHSSQDSGIAASHDIYAQLRKPPSNSDEEAGSTPSYEGGQDSSGSQQSTPSPSPGSAAGAYLDSPKRASVRQQPQPHRPANLGLKGPPSAWDSRQRGAPPPGKRTAVTTPLQTPTPTYSSMGAATAALPPMIPDFHSGDQILQAPVVYRQQAPITTPQSLGGPRRRRPSSFVGDEEDLQRLLTETGLYAATRNSIAGYPPPPPQTAEHDEDATEACLSELSALSSSLEKEEGRRPPPPVPPKPSPAAQKDAYATLPRNFGRTHKGSEDGRLETLTENREAGAGLASLTGHHYAAPDSSTLTRRHSMTGKPPPPTRRNSHITAATPTAPPVDSFRPPSRATTPMEDGFAAMLQTLSARFSASQPASPSAQSIRSGQQGGLSTQSSPLHQVMYQRGNSEPPIAENGPHFDVAHETLLMQIRSGVPLRNSAAMPRDESVQNLRF